MIIVVNLSAIFVTNLFFNMAAIYDKYTHVNNGANTKLADVRPEVLKARFLELFANTGSISKTCDLLGMVRRTFYHWKANDLEFKKKFEEVDEMCLGMLEDEAHRRAVLGVDKPVYQGGKMVGYVREYSDTMLIVLLKARAPHKYKERFAGELTGADGKPLTGELKVIHVNSNIPLAHEEADLIMNKNVTDLPFEDVPSGEQVIQENKRIEGSSLNISDIDEILK